MIEVTHLTKHYGPTTGVDDLSFDVRPGMDHVIDDSADPGPAEYDSFTEVLHPQLSTCRVEFEEHVVPGQRQPGGLFHFTGEDRHQRGVDPQQCLPAPPVSSGHSTKSSTRTTLGVGFCIVDVSTPRYRGRHQTKEAYMKLKLFSVKSETARLCSRL